MVWTHFLAFWDQELTGDRQDDRTCGSWVSFLLCVCGIPKHGMVWFVSWTYIGSVPFFRHSLYHSSPIPSSFSSASLPLRWLPHHSSYPAALVSALFPSPALLVQAASPLLCLSLPYLSHLPLLLPPSCLSPPSHARADRASHAPSILSRRTPCTYRQRSVLCYHLPFRISRGARAFPVLRPCHHRAPSIPYTHTFPRSLYLLPRHLYHHLPFRAERSALAGTRSNCSFVRVRAVRALATFAEQDATPLHLACARFVLACCACAARAHALHHRHTSLSLPSLLLPHFLPLPTLPHTYPILPT